MSENIKISSSNIDFNKIYTNEWDLQNSTNAVPNINIEYFEDNSDKLYFDPDTGKIIEHNDDGTDVVLGFTGEADLLDYEPPNSTITTNNDIKIGSEYAELGPSPEDEAMENSNMENIVDSSNSTSNDNETNIDEKNELQQEKSMLKDRESSIKAPYEIDRNEWNNNVAALRGGVIRGANGNRWHTYYNQPVDPHFGAVAQAENLRASMANLGLEYPRDYHIEDGIEMLGPYIMCAGNTNNPAYTKGNIVDTAFGPGTGIVVDYCEASTWGGENEGLLDICVNW